MYGNHRKAFLEAMEDGDLALFPGASHVTRNHDVEYPFRQQSDFLYLTGCREADAVLMLAKGIEGLEEETLFVLPRDPAKETWTGIRLGTEGAMERLGFGHAASVEDIDEELPAAMRQAKRVWYRLGDHADLDGMVLETLSETRMQARLGVLPPAAIVDPTPALAEMRLFKSEDELALMRRVAGISSQAHALAMAQAQPGMHEYQLEALIDYTFRSNGCEGWSYPAIVATGNNACILHYTSNDAPLKDGEMILIDAGGELQGYAADITRTFPVNGTFTPAQRDAYNAVLAAQQAAIDTAKAGTPFHDVHNAAVKSLCEGLVSLGVLSGTVDEIIEEKQYREWYMHNTSHWIGLDVHDAGQYYATGESRPLVENMCLTVEPGLYFRADDERLPAELRGIGIRIEDDVRITGGDCEILTAATPKSVEDVEAACAAERAMPPTLDSELVAS